MSLTDDMRQKIAAINANMTHSRRGKSCAKYLRYRGGAVVVEDSPAGVTPHSMFPYYSSAMAVDPSEVEAVNGMLRSQGVFAEFDAEGRPRVDSARQHRTLAKAMGLYNGRDGFGHQDEQGKHQSSGRRAGEERAAGRAKIKQLRGKLDSMPDNATESSVRAVLGEYDIFPTSENTA